MKNLLTGLLLTSLPIISLPSFAEEANLLGEFKGSFAYQVAGEFNSTVFGAGRLTEVGVFYADGNGHITANGLANIVTADLSTTLSTGEATYSCTYNDTGAPIASIVIVSCTRNQGTLPPQQASFALSMVNSFGLNKQKTVKIEALSGGTFGNVNITGEGSSK